jgi:hypothetical protein
MSDYFRQAILKYAQSSELYSAQQQLFKESSLEEKYQNGFANRAAQYGFSEQAALDLLKEIRDKKRVLVSIEDDKKLAKRRKTRER